MHLDKSTHGAVRIPGPTGIAALRSAARLKNQPMTELARLTRRYGDVAGIHSGSKLIAVVSDLEHVQRILTDPITFPRPVYPAVTTFLGRGLRVVTGDAWDRRRNMAEPIFRNDPDTLDLDALEHVVNELIESWMPRRGKETAVEVTAGLNQAAVTMGVQGLLGACLSTDEASRLLKLVIDAETLFVKPATGMPSRLKLVPTPGKLRLRKTDRGLDDIILPLIRDNSPRNAQNWLAKFRTTPEPDTGRLLTEREIRDEVVNLVAGQHTIAVTTAWTLHLLAHHQQAQDHVREESQAILGSGNADTDTIDQLTFTEQVMKESLRLFPPIWHLPRTCTKDIELGPHHLPKGSFVVIDTQILHRSAHWDEPDTFRPERFFRHQPDACAAQGYLPFGIGPRRCVAVDIISPQVRLLVARIVQHYRLSSSRGGSIEPTSDFNSVPRNGLRLHLHPLNDIHT